MAPPADWLTEGDLEDFLGVTLTPDTATFMVAAAQAAVRSYLDQDVTEVEADIVYLDGTGRDSFRLPQRPVTGIDEVQEDGVVTPAGTYPDHEWMFNERSGVVFRQAGTWTVGRNNLKVTYDHGYDPDPIYGNFPADLKLASLSYARRVFATLGSTSPVAGAVKQSETIGAYSYTLAEVQAAATATDFAETEKIVLDGYAVRGPRSGSRS